MEFNLTPSVMKYYVPRYNLILLIICIVIVSVFLLRLYYIKKKSKSIKEKRIFIFFYILILISIIIMACIIPWSLNFGKPDMIAQSVLNYTNIIISIITCVIVFLLITEIIINAMIKKKEKES